MTDIITLTGVVATDPTHLLVSGGTLPITRFRLASTERKFDKSKNQWVDAHTNWYTISTFRQLALNAASSIKKGERVIVTGKLRLKEWEHDGKSGLGVDVDADSLGHDISMGTSTWVRVLQSAGALAPPEDAAPDPADDVNSASSGPATTWPTVTLPTGGSDPDRADELLHAVDEPVPTPF